MVRDSELLHEIREVHTDGSIRVRRWSLASSCSLFDPPVGTYLFHVCQPLEHLIGHSKTKVDLFPASKRNIFRVYIRLADIRQPGLDNISEAFRVHPTTQC